MTERDIRYHSGDDMSGLGEFENVMEPVAVVLRPDGSIDAYGYVAVIDQVERGDDTCPAGQLAKLTEAVENITGTDTDTAAWLAGMVIRTMGNMRADSQGLMRP